MNSTILRFIYVCFLLSCVAGCTTTAGDLSIKSTQNAEIEANKQSNDPLIADMCRYGYEDYRRVKNEFDKTYPIGSGGETLHSRIKQNLGIDINSHPIFDPLYPKKGEAPQHNSYFYAAIKNFNKEHGNINQWLVLYFTDLNNVITATEFRLYFDDENFGLRGIPFNFDHFYEKTAQKHYGA